jgi:VanZ family protein
MSGAAGRLRVAAFAAAGGMFVAFAVWGSLFPFRFEPRTWDDVAWLFWLPWDRGPSTWSISDLASNVLLFIPIGLFLTAALDSVEGRAKRPLTVPAIVVGFAAVLSVSLELCQAFIPYRTSSFVDVLAESAGAAAGVCLWRARTEALDRKLSDAIVSVTQASLPCRLLLAYCALFAVAWLLPLDFTLRPREIADKYQHQRLLLPFEPSPDAATGLELGASLAAGLPIGVASVLCSCASGRRSIASGLALAVPALVVLEAVQVTVFSRTTDTTSLLALMAGAAAGAASVR